MYVVLLSVFWRPLLRRCCFISAALPALRRYSRPSSDDDCALFRRERRNPLLGMVKIETQASRRVHRVQRGRRGRPDDNAASSEPQAASPEAPPQAPHREARLSARRLTGA